MLAETSPRPVRPGAAELGALSRLVAGAQQPSVSPLIRDEPGGTHFVLIAVPVFRAVASEMSEGTVVAVLAARIGADAIGRVLQQQNVPEGVVT